MSRRPPSLAVRRRCRELGPAVEKGTRKLLYASSCLRVDEEGTRAYMMCRAMRKEEMEEVEVEVFTRQAGCLAQPVTCFQGPELAVRNSGSCKISRAELPNDFLYSPFQHPYHTTPHLYLTIIFYTPLVMASSLRLGNSLLRSSNVLSKSFAQKAAYTGARCASTQVRPDVNHNDLC